MDEPFGTTTAPAAAGVMRAPTILIFEPPAAENTGGASPTPPMSTESEPIACTMGGPEVKSTHLALNGSLLISPAACSSASAPVPFWSPMVSVTDETLTVEPEALDDDGELPDEAELPDDEEQAATASTVAVPATANTARPRLVRTVRMELIMMKGILVFSGKCAQETSAVATPSSVSRRIR